MIRITTFAVASLMACAAGSAVAAPQTPPPQDEPLLEVQVEVREATPEDAAAMANRLRLAGQFVELSILEPMRKNTEAMVETSLAEGSDMTPEQSAWWGRQLPEFFAAISEDIAAAVTPYYAERLTEAELEALLAFYGTPAGREIMRKTTQIGFETGELVLQTAGAAMGELLAKFCTEFDCAALAAPAAGGAKF
jgi:hypothetical protein